MTTLIFTDSEGGKQIVTSDTMRIGESSRADKPCLRLQAGESNLCGSGIDYILNVTFNECAEAITKADNQGLKVVDLRGIQKTKAEAKAPAP